MKALLTILILVLPAVVSAGSTTIINNVSASASTGGNSVSGGEMIEGSSRSSVEVYTEVNGEVIEDFQKEVSGGEEVNYEAEKKFEGGEVKTEVKVNAEVEADTSTSINADVNSEEEQSFLSSLPDKVSDFIKYVFSFFKF